MIKVLIGPNGYGKTYRLDEIRKQKIESGIDENKILYFESEMLLSNEIKDSKDDTKIMEFIFENIISTDKINELKNNLEKAVDEQISASKDYMNNILNEAMAINGADRKEENLIQESSKKAYKSFVTTNNKDYLTSFGSGQRMFFLLSLIKESDKDIIILDEPEKHAHPSLLNKIAKILNDLDHKGKEIYIASNSPKMISMLDIDLDNISIINDSSHELKIIPYNDICQELSKTLPISCIPAKSKKMYDSGDGLKEVIKKLYYREFVESLFTNKIYICEGCNDELFIKEILRRNNESFEDYNIFKTYGKYHMPLFIKIFKFLSVDIVSYYDIDSNEEKDTAINSYIKDNSKSVGFTTNSDDKRKNNLESEIEYTKDKGNTIDFIDYLETLDDEKYKAYVGVNNEEN